MYQKNEIKILLKGLNCAGCAAKIEAKANTIEYVVEATLNMVTGILNIVTADTRARGDIVSDVINMVRDIEPGIVAEDITDQNRGIGTGFSTRRIGPGGEVGSAATKGEIAAGRVRKGILTFQYDDIKKETIILILGGLFFFAAIGLPLGSHIKLALFIISYIIVGGKMLSAATRNIIRGKIFDENFLMGISTLGALSIGEYPEAVAVMLFFRTGELMQDLAVDRSRRSIAELMDIRPEYATLKKGERFIRVRAEEVDIGEKVMVRPGERIPLDGEILEGVSTADTSDLTGEAMPRDIGPGAEVLAGFINKNGLIILETKRRLEEAAVTKILELVEDAGARKAPTEKFITKFSRYYTPAVVLAAAVLAFVPPLIIPGATFSQWIYRALVFLVVSCPCALIVSIPLGFFGGIGGASKRGILVKGGSYLEMLTNVGTVVFDKTGTLTEGVFKVASINPTAGVTEEELLEYAARAEYGSNHPIALSILEAFGMDPRGEGVTSYDETPGFGIKAIIDGETVLAGNARLMDDEGVTIKPADEPGTVVYVARDGEFIGSITVADVIKDGASDTIKGLRGLGIKNTAMLTGDNKKVAKKVAGVLGIDKVYAELLPHQKVSMVEALQRDGHPRHKTVFVGDGINDAPALARADIGVAMGGLGSDAAIEAADVVIMTDEPGKLIQAIQIAKRTKAIVWQNIVFALGVKALVLALGAGGSATMWEAVFADVGVALIAVLNSMRVMTIKAGASR